MRVIPFTTTRVQVRLAPPHSAPTRLTHSLHPQPALRRESQWCPARGQHAFHLMAATTRISASDSSDSPRLPPAVAGRLQSLAPLQCIPPGESTSGGFVVVLPAVPCSCPATPRGPRGFHVPTSERLENSSPMTTVTFSPAWNRQTLLVRSPMRCWFDSMGRSPLGRTAGRSTSRTRRVVPTGTAARHAAGQPPGRGLAPQL